MSTCVPVSRTDPGARASVPSSMGLPTATLIDTPDGLRPAGSLCAGDAVLLSCGGVAEIAASVECHAQAGTAGVIISAGLFGDGTPGGDLILPAGQLVHVSGGLTATVCGADAALLPARHLCAIPGVRPAILPEWTGILLVLDRPGIIGASGLGLAPFVPTEDAVGRVDADAREALFSTCPKARYPGAAAALTLDLPVLDDRDLGWLGEAATVAFRPGDVAESACAGSATETETGSCEPVFQII